jgi:IS4 transposase
MLGRSKKAQSLRADGIRVRVIEYALPEAAVGGNARGNKTGSTPGGKKRAVVPTRYRLMTTLFDAKRAPALELAKLYHERWEIEGTFDELKTHLAQRRRCFRSKTAEGVRQEFYGWLLAHYAVCWLMHQAASAERLRTRQLSFTGNLRLLRLTQPHSGAFPPTAGKKASAAL